MVVNPLLKVTMPYYIIAVITKADYLFTYLPTVLLLYRGTVPIFGPKLVKFCCRPAFFSLHPTFYWFLGTNLLLNLIIFTY